MGVACDGYGMDSASFPAVPPKELVRHPREGRFGILDRVRMRLRASRYSPRTEQAYIEWIRQFVLFHGRRHPQAMGEAEVSAFVTHLANDKNVSASTQNQALNALG